MHREFRRLTYIALTFAFVFLCGSHRAQAQCSNTNINSAYQTALHRAPRGSGTSGECNPGFYGGGAWSSQADLIKRVGAASYCSNNPWIGQIYLYEYGRYPNWSECTANYGYNPSMQYMQLDAAIKAYVARGQKPAGQPGIPAASIATSTAPSTILKYPPAGSYEVTSTGALIDSSGRIIAQPGTYVVNTNGSNIVAAGGGNIVAAGGGNIVAAGGGNIVAAGGGNMVSLSAGMIITPSGNSYALASVGGKRVIQAARITR